MLLNNQLPLTQSQRQRLEDIEKQSFLDYCQLMGYSPVEHEVLLLRIAKEELETILQMVAINNPKEVSQIREGVKERLSATDWWTFKKLHIRSQAESVAEGIAKQVSSLPINWDYLRRVCNELGLPSPTSGDPHSIASFVLTIPHLQIYGSEFNAFVQQETLVDNIPCVSVYEQLIMATEGFLDVVMNAISYMKPDGTVSVLAPDMLRKRGRDSRFIDACTKCLNTVLCRQNVIIRDNDLLISRSVPEMHMPFQFMVFGATGFVWNHEYWPFAYGAPSERVQPSGRV